LVNTIVENNKVYLLGEILTELTFSHEMYGEKFYQCDLGVSRLSDSIDTIPLLVSDRLLMGVEMAVGSKIEVNGQFRSHNVARENEKSKLVLTVFVRDIKNVTEESEENNPNQIYVEGFVCKKPNYRKTPFGREISDLLIAVNRLYNKSDYLPCIAWGRNARYCETMEVGERIRVWGRVQSREYEKKFEDGTVEKRVAYEVSVAKLEKIKDEEEMQDDE